MSGRALSVGAWLVAGLCLLPMVAAVLAAFSGTFEVWRGLLDTVLPRYAQNTALLVVWVGGLTAILGTGTAWLVTVYRFPGSRWLEILLALPLAFPAYVLAYAYTDLLDHPGLVQSALRGLMGWGPRDYWFPEIRSLGGAAMMLSFVLYPYVYLLARAAFRQQSCTTFLAARALGHGPWSAFFRVAMPMARPAIAGGVLLAIMETIADFGTVAHFNVPTFATGIYQAWFTFADRPAAAQLALCLLMFALLLAGLERTQRGAMRFSTRPGEQFSTMQKERLRGRSALLASGFCAFPVLFGFAVPLVVLGEMAWDSGQSLRSARYLGFMGNSLLLAGIAAGLTVLGAVLVAHRARTLPGRASRAMVLTAGLGYAVPGGVIAIGLLVPFAAFDNALNAWMVQTFGIRTGLLVTGSIWLLVLAYLVRFMAAALNAIDAGLAQVGPRMDAVARTLGQSAPQVLWNIHLPLLRGSVLTAGLIVFVDVMKELPATLIMRPFNFDTLAVQAHRLASDERLAQAAVPSLVIVAFGLVPVVLVCRGLREMR